MLSIPHVYQTFNYTHGSINNNNAKQNVIVPISQLIDMHYVDFILRISFSRTCVTLIASLALSPPILFRATNAASLTLEMISFRLKKN